MSAPLSINGATVQTTQCAGRIVMGLDTTGATPTERVLAINASGQLIVVIIAGAPGGNILTDADVAVGVGVTAALGVPGATTRTMMIQQTTSGAQVRVREVGAAAGSGILLGFRESRLYSAGIEACEAECIGAVAATVAVQYETA